MARFEDMAFRRPRTEEVLLFLLGLFSTMQIVQIAGFPVFTLLSVLTAGYFVLTRGFYFRKDWLLLATFAAMVVTLVVSMVSDLPTDYKKVAFTGTILWFFVLFICCYVRRENTDHFASVFLRGFDWSCRIQLVWCILQMGAFYGLGIDINAKIFGDLLHMSDLTSQYRGDILACTGLHWHAANLTPVLIYAYFRNRNVFIKALCLVLVYLTKSATAIIAIVAAVGLDFLSFSKKTLCENRSAVSRKTTVYVVVGLIALLVVSPVLFPKVRETVEYLLLRIYQIWNPSYGNESSTVHFNYYRFLPNILKKIPIQEVFFGSGLNTSGHRFSYFYGQYAESVWTVESDFVNSILNKGVIGVFLQYGFLFVLFYRLRKTGLKNFSHIILVLIACGFIYDNQFIWVLLMEYILYCRSYQYPKERISHE